MTQSHSLWTQGFRLSFTPLPGFFSPFLHSTLLYRSLGGVSPCGVVPASSARVPRVPAYSGSRGALHALRIRGSHPLRPAFPKPFCWAARAPCAVLNPGAPCAPVWAPPVPLAATPGIDVSSSSSGYLDVSVRRVPFRALCVHARIHGVRPVWVPPFRHPRINGHLPLPAAFRSLSRLSSAPSAKASALRPYLLGHGAPHSVAARRLPSLLGLSFLVFSSCFALYGVFKVHPPRPRRAASLSFS